MTSAVSAARERLLVIGAGATAGYAVTYVVKHFVPQLFLFWLFSGAGLAFLLACWKPRQWAFAGPAVVSLVVLDLVLHLGDAGPTSSALALGFALFWLALALAGAWLGRLVALSQSSDHSGDAT